LSFELATGRPEISLVSMIIADRMESLTRYYDRWMYLITGGQDKRVRDTVLGYVVPGSVVLDEEDLEIEVSDAS
jgi:hypothetical protein